ncbi:MAG: hypothetical protein LBU44_09780 [Mediterranea sp.]|jgi:uncharacterized lipoprotein YajG|nr:hypothetical protein [Mediterranea sp.]
MKKKLLFFLCAVSFLTVACTNDDDLITVVNPETETSADADNDGLIVLGEKI